LVTSSDLKLFNFLNLVKNIDVTPSAFNKTRAYK